MAYKDPLTYSILEYVGVIALAAWGGIVNYMRRFRGKVEPHFSIMELVGEVATSGFAGVLAFWLCEAVGMRPLITAATVGIAGHIGGRTLILIEHVLMRHFSISRDRD